MESVAQKLVRGSAEIDRMKHELDELTSMVFGLAKHPRYWIRSHELMFLGNNFITEYGSLKESGVWQVWSDTRLKARFLFEDEEKGLMLAYQTRPTAEALYSDRVRTKLLVPVTELKYAGVQRAHENLDIFIKGMMSEFPITHMLQPFFEAAEE